MSPFKLLHGSTEPVFSKLLRDELERRKYARWAANLTEDQLLALFTAIGSIGEDGYELFEMLRRHTPENPYTYAKSLVGFEAVWAASLATPLSQMQFHERLIPAMKKGMAEFKARQAKQREAGEIL
jgi:hypothetical protein